MIDWLTEFPFLHTPPTWTLNSLFLRKLKEMTEVWADAGYRWHFGHEVEFLLLNGMDEMRKLEKRQKTSPLYNSLLPENLRRMRLAEAMRANPPSPDIYKETLGRLREFYTLHPDAKGRSKSFKRTIPEILEELDKYAAGADSSHPKHDPLMYGLTGNTVKFSRQNIFLAFLHTFDFNEGGLYDVVEPRFGENLFGFGWYDQKVPEVRCRMASGPLDTIIAYHKTLYQLNRQAVRFGFMPDMIRGGAPHLHYSIWRNADNRNMMITDNEETATFGEKIMGGYVSLMHDMPHLFIDPLTSQPEADWSGTTGSSRYNMIRQEVTNSELRRRYGEPVGHMAKDLMMIMGGATYGYICERAFADDLKKSWKGHVSRQRKLIVRDPFTGEISALKSTLEHCQIEPNGDLFPSRNAIYGNLPRLVQEIGKKNTGMVKMTDPTEKITWDLRHIQTWEAIFSQLHVNDDGTLDTSELASTSELQAMIDNLQIDGIRTVFKTNVDGLASGPHRLHRAPGKTGIAASCLFTNAEQKKIARVTLKNYADFRRQYARLTIEEIRSLKDKTDLSEIFTDYVTRPSMAHDELFFQWMDRRQLIKDGEIHSLHDRRTFLTNTSFAKWLAPAIAEISAEEIEHLCNMEDYSNPMIAVCQDLRTNFMRHASLPEEGMLTTLCDAIRRQIEALKKPKTKNPAISIYQLSAVTTHQLFMCLGNEHFSHNDIEESLCNVQNLLMGFCSKIEKENSDVLDEKKSKVYFETKKEIFDMLARMVVYINPPNMCKDRKPDTPPSERHRKITVWDHVYDRK